MRRGAAKVVHNPEVRRFLVPWEQFEGPSPAISMGAHSYFFSTPHVHHYSPNDTNVSVGRYCSISREVDAVAPLLQSASLDEFFERVDARERSGRLGDLGSVRPGSRDESAHRSASGTNQPQKVSGRGRR